MTRNSIKRKLGDAGITQAAAAEQMPDAIGKVGMSFIVTGKVLPTKEGLEVLCSLLDCAPSDLYSPADINLLSVCELEEESEAATITSDSGSKSGGKHDDMHKFQVWLRPYEQEAIEKAVAELGYRSLAEWLREMIRNTVARNKRLQGKAPVGA